MAEDTEEKAVWEDNPQTVYEKYSAGEASIEDYIKSLSICDVTEFAKQSHNFVKVYGDMKNQYESASSTAGEKKAAQHYMLVLESIHNDQSEKFENLQQPASTEISHEADDGVVIFDKEVKKEHEENKQQVNEDFAQAMEQPWKSQEIHEAEHEQFEEMDMSPENVAADNRQAVNEDFAKEMEQPWKSQEIHEAEHEQFEEMDMSPENVAATENDGATFSALQQAGQRVMDNVDLNAGETIDLDGDTKTPNSDTFSGLQTAADKIKENLQSGGTTVDLDDEITITLNPPANAASVKAKMDKAMDDAAEAFAGIKGVKIERGTVDISNGEFKFTPREAPAAEQPTPTDDKVVEAKAAPTEAKAAPTEEKAAPTVEQAAPTVEQAAPTVEQAAPAPQSHEAEAVSPDIADMAKKIRYMNTVNNAEEGSAKYVDPQETAQKMYALYGENASTLLNEAIMAPNDVNNHADGAITSRTQTYSREAVDYLANLSPEQAKEYANRVLSPAELGPEKSPQEKLQDGLADMKTNNPEQYGDFTSAISKLANGGNLEEALMQLVIQMMKQAGYADSPQGREVFTQDAQTAIQQIEHSERLEKAKTGIEMPTAVNVAQTQIKPIDMEKIKGIKLDSYGLVEGSEQAQKHNEDLEQYRELYKTDPKKFEKAKEGYEKAVKSGETTGQAKYNLDVINTVEKEEKLKEQMLKDQEKAAKQIKKLEKKIEKAKSKGNDEKAKSLQEELDKLMKEQGLKKEDEGKAGKEGKESKAGKEGKDGKEGKESKAGKEGKDGQAVAGQPKDTPVTETEYAEATQNGFKITKGDEVRTVTFENGGRIMHFTVNDKPMTQTEANQFMKDLQEAPNLDQEKVGLAVVQKNINEMSGSQTYAKESTQQQGTQDNTLSLNNLVAMQKGGNSMS